MIKTEQQYRITQEQAHHFRKAIKEATAMPPDAYQHPLLRKATIESLKSQLETLEQELAAWEQREEVYDVTFTVTLRYKTTVYGKTKEAREEAAEHIYGGTDFADYDVIDHEEIWDKHQ